MPLFYCFNIILCILGQYNSVEYKLFGSNAQEMSIEIANIVRPWRLRSLDAGRLPKMVHHDRRKSEF